MKYYSLSVASLALLWFSAAHAQTENTSTWPYHNRYVALNVGQQQQNYRELDTQGLTTDGTLDRESGAQTHAQTALRWQWASGITAQLSHARQNGATAYQGYLQNGAGNLTPYAARTGNVAHQTSVQLGYAINSGNNATIPSNWQLTPLLVYTQHRWQRNLAQYSETYRHTSTAAGLRLQWQATPSTVIEAQALLGRTQPARATVPAFDFSSQQASGNYRQWQLAASYDISQYFSSSASKSWRLTAQINSTLFSHGASAVVNGLQAPPNQHRPSDWSLGISKHF